MKRIHDDPVVNWIHYFLMGILAFVLMAVVVAMAQVYLYEPFVSWQEGHPYKWHNWAHILSLLWVYMMVVTVCGFMLYLLYGIYKRYGK